MAKKKSVKVVRVDPALDRAFSNINDIVTGYYGKTITINGKDKPYAEVEVVDFESQYRIVNTALAEIREGLKEIAVEAKKQGNSLWRGYAYLYLQKRVPRPYIHTSTLWFWTNAHTTTAIGMLATGEKKSCTWSGEGPPQTLGTHSCLPFRLYRRVLCLDTAEDDHTIRGHRSPVEAIQAAAYGFSLLPLYLQNQLMKGEANEMEAQAKRLFRMIELLLTHGSVDNRLLVELEVTALDALHRTPAEINADPKEETPEVKDRRLKDNELRKMIAEAISTGKAYSERLAKLNTCFEFHKNRLLRPKKSDGEFAVGADPSPNDTAADS